MQFLQKTHLQVDASVLTLWPLISNIKVSFWLLAAEHTMTSRPQRQKYFRAAEQSHAAPCIAIWKTTQRTSHSVIVRTVRWWISVFHAPMFESHVSSVCSYWHINQYHSNPCRWVGDGLDTKCWSDHLKITVGTVHLKDLIWEILSDLPTVWKQPMRNNSCVLCISSNNLYSEWVNCTAHLKIDRQTDCTFRYIYSQIQEQIQKH